MSYRESVMHRYLPDFIVIAFYACTLCLLVATANSIVRADGMSEDEWESAASETTITEEVIEEKKAQLRILNEERLEKLISDLKDAPNSAKEDVLKKVPLTE